MDELIRGLVTALGQLPPLGWSVLSSVLQVWLVAALPVFVWANTRATASGSGLLKRLVTFCLALYCISAVLGLLLVPLRPVPIHLGYVGYYGSDLLALLTVAAWAGFLLLPIRYSSRPQLMLLGGAALALLSAYLGGVALRTVTQPQFATVHLTGVQVDAKGQVTFDLKESKNAAFLSDKLFSQVKKADVVIKDGQTLTPPLALKVVWDGSGDFLFDPSERLPAPGSVGSRVLADGLLVDALLLLLPALGGVLGLLARPALTPTSEVS